MSNIIKKKSFKKILCFVGKDLDYGLSTIEVIIKQKIDIVGIVGENAQKIYDKVFKSNENNCFIINYKRPWEHPRFFDHIDKKTLGINCGSDYIIPEKVLKKIAIVNMHPAYLPYNKGCHHSFWGIIDKTPLGASMHWMDKALDAGPIIDQIELKDDGFLFAHQIQKISNKLCIDLLEKNIKNIIQDNKNSYPNQDGSYHSKGQIKEASTIKQDQNLTGDQLFDLCRATFNKNNGFFITKNGRKFLIKINDIVEIE